MKIFLDMDGVIVDFIQGIRDFYETEYNPTSWDLPYDQFGVTAREFWNDLDSYGFWRDLSWTKDGRELVFMLKHHDITITTQAPNPGAAEGKLLWLKRELPDFYYKKRYFIVGGKKHLLASKDRILIDDSEDNCRRWAEEGGRAILYPRPWNSNRDVEDGVEYLKQQLLR